jgi:hypothetical protein
MRLACRAPRRGTLCGHALAQEYRHPQDAEMHAKFLFDWVQMRQRDRSCCNLRDCIRRRSRTSEKLGSSYIARRDIHRRGIVPACRDERHVCRAQWRWIAQCSRLGPAKYEADIETYASMPVGARFVTHLRNRELRFSPATCSHRCGAAVVLARPMTVGNADRHARTGARISNMPTAPSAGRSHWHHRSICFLPPSANAVTLSADSLRI